MNKRVKPAGVGHGGSSSNHKPAPPIGAPLSPPVTAARGSLLRWRAMAAIGFALLVFFWPRLTAPGLTLLWGGYSLIDGILALTAANAGNSGRPRTWLNLIGMAGIACAGAVLITPEWVTQHLVEIIAAWAILTGAMQVWIALKLRRRSRANGSWPWMGSARCFLVWRWQSGRAWKCPP
jgi:uncharacterized membrane protein HdeD (DUF308 family)